MRALGIDIGSTSIKGAVLDLSTMQVMPPVARPFPAPLKGLPGGWIEVDPVAVCEAVDDVLSLLIQQAPEADWLGFSGQMGGVILLDQQGQPLSNYISWQDQRVLADDSSGRPLLDKVHEIWNQAGIFAELGRELQPGSTTVLLAWLQSHNQLPQHAIPTNIADFVIARRLGRRVPMHATHAIGMLDLAHGDWHHQAFARIGLENMTLPELGTSESSVGQWRYAGRTFNVFGSYGDQQLALRGAGLQSDELSLNVSTGSQVSRRSARFQPGPYQSRVYFFGDLLNTVTHLPAGRSLNILVDLLTELARAEGILLRHPWDTINSLVDAVAETDLNVDLAFFRGPLGSRGRIENISTENLSAGTLIYAAFRAMAQNYFEVAERFSPRDWKGVVLSGGLTQKAPTLRRLLQKSFPVPLRESAGEETLAGLLDIARVDIERTARPHVYGQERG